MDVTFKENEKTLQGKYIIVQVRPQSNVNKAESNFMKQQEKDHAQ